MQNTMVSIIVPAKDEAKSLPELLSRVDAVMKSIQRPYEFWLIDDGSTDDTAQVMVELCAMYPSAGILRLRANYGKSMALMQGFQIARGEVVVTMDADLQDEPEDIPSLLEKLEQGYDLVGGWRQSRQDPFAKRFVSRVFNWLIQRVSGRTFNDINCGFKAFTKELAGCLELYGDMHRLIPAIAASYGFATVEHPVSHKPRRYGESRYKLLRYRGLLDLVSFAVLRPTQIRPFHTLCKVSFFCLFICAVMALGVWSATYIFDEGPVRALLRFTLVGTAILTGIIAVMSPFVGLIVESILVNRHKPIWHGRTLVARVRRPAVFDQSGISVDS